ncbi:SIMPL domain-containing protein [Priestia koreensis]|uniref:SIMPL domain-containing protein n=1 Tax=Priestia koreensis TaxID=284581 RepID=UPI001F59C7E5|nr:SIMPL domain-containing protein [Priestia koreensis]UNL86044.1 SIMPL domain-containing protein [Priestia koreensis]
MHGLYPQDHYHEHDHLNALTVNGKSEIEVMPDQISLTIGVRTEELTVQEALKKNAQLSNDMIQALHQIGIQNGQIETKSFSVHPRYDYHDGHSTLIGYEVLHLFEITVSDVKQAGQVYDTALTSGANLAQDIQFSVKKPEQYYQQALTDALLNAQEKAATLAQTMQVPLQRIPFKIIEESSQYTQDFQASYKGFAASSTPIQPQTLKISASVRAWFRYS